MLSTLWSAIESVYRSSVCCQISTISLQVVLGDVRPSSYMCHHRILPAWWICVVNRTVYKCHVYTSYVRAGCLVSRTSLQHLVINVHCCQVVSRLQCFIMDFHQCVRVRSSGNSIWRVLRRWATRSMWWVTVLVFSSHGSLVFGGLYGLPSLRLKPSNTSRSLVSECTFMLLHSSNSFTMGGTQYGEGGTVGGDHLSFGGGVWG